jgi:conjugal transfer mating pair stabilization protein TraG
LDDRFRHPCRNDDVIANMRIAALTGVDLNLVPIDSIMRQPQLLNAIRFDSNIYTAEIYTGGAPKILECTHARFALDDYVRNIAVP